MRSKRNFIEQMRTKIGLTQEHFAQLLKISRSHLSMSELGRRALPPASSLILGKMHRDFVELENGALANYRSLETKLIVNEEYRKALPGMESKEKHCRLQLKELKDQLAEMKAKARDCENWIIVITRLVDEIKEDPVHNKEVEWLLLMTQQCYTRMLTCWEPEQAKLTVKIEAMAGEARALRRYRLKVKQQMES